MKFAIIRTWCLILLCPSLVKAGALFPVGLPEKVKNATLIAEGEVTDRQSFWNQAHTMIFTSNTVKISRVFSGTTSSAYVKVLTQGGSVDDFNITASELLTLDKGDAGTFFLFPNELKLKDPADGSVLMDVYASSQGCYKYNTIRMSAAVPFDSYASITGQLYPAITNLTGQALRVIDPSVNYGTVATSGVSQNSITDFNPKTVTPGAFLNTDSSVLTITGSGFGAPNGTGRVSFPNADNGGSGVINIPDTSKLVLSWTSSQIKLKIPSKAGSGIFQVRSSTGTIFSSPMEMNVYYSISTASFGASGTQLPVVMIDQNGLGGYDVYYSTSTAGGGKNLNTAPEKAPIQRALNTWKEVCGANITEAGTTTTQAISSDDGLNIFVMDNTNSTVGRLPSGVLATTYSYAYTCSSGGTYPYPAIRSGFDVLIRNTGVSTGTTTFTVGPCPPASGFSDLETVVLHEMGHALVLDHIIDPWEGNLVDIPFVNPPKLMNYALPNGVKRSSPDISALAGALYVLRKKNVALGTCAEGPEITALARITESKDECPLSFPVNTTQNNTVVNFDLVHATSNKYVDPQYTNILCDFSSTSITNTAFYALKTGSGSGSISINVSNYATLPANQKDCSNTGIELALYLTNTCPQGQNYPNVFACRLFNANGILDSIKNLQPNKTYLLVANGLYNTKANFTLTFTGPALSSGATYVFTGNGLWSNAANWQNNIIPPSVLPTGSQIIISPQVDGQCILDVSQTISSGATLTVSQNKSFVIQGPLTMQ